MQEEDRDSGMPSLPRPMSAEMGVSAGAGAPSDAGKPEVLSAADGRSRATRDVRQLAGGTKWGLGLAAIMVIGAVVLLAWPTTATSADGTTTTCGTASSLTGPGDQCSVAQGQHRLQGLGLLASAIITAVTFASVFGTRTVTQLRAGEALAPGPEVDPK